MGIKSLKKSFFVFFFKVLLNDAKIPKFSLSKMQNTFSGLPQSLMDYLGLDVRYTWVQQPSGRHGDAVATLNVRDWLPQRRDVLLLKGLYLN